MGRVNTMTGMRMLSKAWDYMPDPADTCYRIEVDRRGFWTGRIFCSLPSQGHHKLLFERCNGLPIDLGHKCVVGEVKNDLVDFSGCQLGDLGDGMTGTQVMGGPYSLSSHDTARTAWMGSAASSSQLPPSVLPLPADVI
jgi:hypothetical protein